jgi:hypothetical protein
VSPAVASIVVTLLFLAVVGGVVALTGGAGSSPSTAGTPGVPWRGRPTVWAAVALALVLLGAFLFPRLLGFTFVFLPFIWMRRSGAGNRRPPTPPES